MPKGFIFNVYQDAINWMSTHMTEEEKQAAEAAAAEEAKKAEAEATEEDEPIEDEIPDGEGDDDIEKEGEKDEDPKDKALKDELDARLKAEKALATKRFQEAEARRKSKEEEDGKGDEGKPLTQKQLESILARERRETEKRFNATRVAEEAKKLATSDTEAELIVAIHGNRTWPEDMSIPEQIEEAYILANKKKFVGERNEALRALRGKTMVRTDGAGTHRDSPTVGAPKISPADAAAFKAAGMLWNGIKRWYEKKLPNGDLLVRDPKTKATRIVKKSK